ncbi:alpha/beta hydrolase [Pollutibacter soli]|uniref:alpha/beta fold hydrolase n=1 Tax=Pollutibacter soli TaxID=3034157 RepID=UPI0030138E25
MHTLKKRRFTTKRTVIVLGSLLILWLLFAQSCVSFQITDANAKKQFKQKGLILKTGSLEIGSHEIYYTMVGNDSLPTLIFIHGSPGTWSAFSDYMEDPEMLYHYRMIAFDRPGFGYSRKGGAMNLADQSKILESATRYFKNNRPVYLAGHSLGSPIAMQMAADMPGYFSAIGLISTPIDPALEEKERWRSAMSIFPLKYLLPGAFRPSNEELLFFKNDIVTLGKQLDKIDCRVVLIHGKEDRWVPLGNIYYAQKKLTHAKKVDTLIVEGANHFIPFTHRKEVKAALISMADSSASN